MSQLIARWSAPAEPAYAALLRRAGVDTVYLGTPPSPAFAEAARTAGLAVDPAATPANAVTRGLWPGIRRPGRQRNWDNDLFSSASAEPWIDSNVYVAPLERALGNTAPVIAYQANAAAGLAADRSVPFETLEIALIEARLGGGNYLLSLDPRYRAALLAGDKAAVAAWTSLGRTHAWLAANAAALCGHAAPAGITQLVEPGNHMNLEISNLLSRRNASPRFVPATASLTPDPGRLAVLVAAGLKAAPPAFVWKHAEAGSMVVTDDTSAVSPSWRKTKQEEDRAFYATGRGQVLVYNKRIADPSEFALDVIDLLGHRRRTARLWNAQSAVTFATSGAAPGEALLHLINYGSPVREEVQARIHGHFREAVLLRPESAAPATLKVSPRGLASEVFLPNLERVAVVRFRAREE
ncbi:MAG: hypothetical protein FJW31_07825 [Acidobacteria bacterium]|nr:hypothetical protein [Acidobacteriota bacterium]